MPTIERLLSSSGSLVESAAATTVGHVLMVAENGDLLRRVWWAKHLGYVRFLTDRYFSFLSLADCKLARASIRVIRSKSADGRNKAPNGSKLHDGGTKASRRACHNGQDRRRKHETRNDFAGRRGRTFRRQRERVGLLYEQRIPQLRPRAACSHGLQ